ncbi:MAG TPA: hypothetical protein VGK52_11015, partial [Polyangia bacterium]
MSVAVSALVGAGCVGAVSAPGASPGGPGSGAAGTGGPATGSAGTGTVTVGPLTQPVPALRKLTIAEFTNSIRDLLGSNAPVPPQLE